MTRLADCLQVVLQFEGGYVFKRQDHGGATNFGITQRVYDEHRIRRGLPQQPVQFIDQCEVAEIYRAGYWDVCRCSKLDAPLDLVVFDCAVNSGSSRSVMLLQRVVGVPDDGRMGPATLGAITQYKRDGDTEKLAHAHIDRRRDFLREIVRRDPSQMVFLRGWLARLDKLGQLVDGK